MSATPAPSSDQGSAPGRTGGREEPHLRPSDEPRPPPEGSTAPTGDLGGPGEAWGREIVAEYLLRLRVRGVRDLAVLRAVEAVPRPHFVEQPFRALAGRDIALPLPCGQTMSEPFAVARAIEALRVSPGCRVLEIGSGSGYASAILARLCREVLAVERFQRLVLDARKRLADLDTSGVTVIWADGLALPADLGCFDRILVHAEMDGMPANLSTVLAQDGVAVYARAMPGREVTRRCVVSAERDRHGDWIETPFGPSRLRPLLLGSSQEL